MQRHPLSSAFPTMSEEEHHALRTDIKLNGQQEPITIFEGMVLDGWHRYIACKMLEIEPVFSPEFVIADPVAFVLSRNMHRRHLTGSQRAAAVVACNEWAAVGKPKANMEPGSTLGQMAAQADVSVKTIQQAKAAQTAGLSEKVINGELSAKAAVDSLKPESTPPAPDVAGSETVTVSKSALAERDALINGLIAESVAFEKIVDADDKLTEMFSTIKMQLSTINTLQSQLNGANEKNNELIRMVKSLNKRVGWLEKENDRLKIEALPV